MPLNPFKGCLKTIWGIKYKVQSTKYSRLLLVFTLPFCVFSCSNTPEEIASLDQKNEPLEFAKDIELYYSDSAVIKFVLKAPLLERYVLDKDSSYVEFKKGATVHFYDASGHPETTLLCDYALQYEKSDVIVAKKNVRVSNKFGDQMQTEELWWNKKTKRVYTKAFVKIQTPEEIIYGDGLESNEDFTKYRILNIKGTLTVKDEELP